MSLKYEPASEPELEDGRRQDLDDGGEVLHVLK